MLHRFSLLLLGLLAASSLQAIDKKPDADGFVTIFDGTSLDGWKKAMENPDVIQLKDGAIVMNPPGSTPTNVAQKNSGAAITDNAAKAKFNPEREASPGRSHLFYVGEEQPFKNFDFKCEVMTQPGSNGGIYFHTKYQDTNWPAQGHECQVNNSYEKDPQKTGGVYKVAKVAESPAKDNEWFKYEIIVQGKHVVVKINDKVTADYTEDADALAKEKGIEPGRRVGEGTFALQAHDPGSTVMYRNIKVKRLP